ncbi:MAG TPA: LCP family protein [Solirubrobacterales bacterium]|nr:LCP family protein [Solirubrobacterales bacterium]
MNPEREGGNGRDDEGQRPDEVKRPDETQEFNVADELGADEDEQPRDEQPRDEQPDDDQAEQDEPEAEEPEADEPEENGQDESEPDEEQPEEEEPEDEEPGTAESGADEELSDEDRLAQVVSAPTQEWEGLEAAEAKADEPTVIQKAGSAITSSFEKVGSATTSGFRVVREHVRFPIWLRFLTASFVIVATIAAATSASLILYLSDWASALKSHAIRQHIDTILSDVPSSGAQTILIIGSDKRNEAISGQYGLSDTTMLLRLDPDRNAIALLSLPRDLKVDIPDVGTDKLNAAYSLGGPKLTLRTVKQITGLQVNHLVNVDFTGFARAVNAIGCVYVDVDRRYYIAPNTGTAEINLQPGYQALCGFDALSFVRYRHTDNDIVRSARQQAFLREARAKVPPSRLIDERDKFLNIFTNYTSSDLDNFDQLLELLKLFINLRGAEIKQVHLNSTLGPSYVTATQSQIKQAVNQFLGVTGTPGPAGSTAKPEQKVEAQRPPDYSPPTPAAPKKKKQTQETDLTRTTYGKALARGIRARKTKVPIYYPTILEQGSDYAQKPRVYKINGKGDESPPHAQRGGYKWVFSLPTIGDYYGFEGTLWKDPPILDGSNVERTIGDRTYKLYYDGDRLRMVAWQTDRGSFWISNSFIETVPNQDMIKIAVGMRQLRGT